jgi:3-oxoacyl-[acyl-carrier-protein] synthase II
MPRSAGRNGERRRVVLTGIGPVSPVGIGLDDFWGALVSGRSGISRIERFDTSDLPVHIAGEVKPFAPEDWVTPKEAKRTDRATHFAVAASKLAWKDAGEPSVDRARTGVFLSTGIGGLGSLLQQHRVFLDRGADRVSPFMVPMLMPNASAGHVAMAFGFTGPNECIVTACAAGAHAVGEAAMAIRDGKIPPTINLENPDPECDLDYTPNVAREKKVRVGVNNSFGFGGHNATLVVTQFKD